MAQTSFRNGFMHLGLLAVLCFLSGMKRETGQKSWGLVYAHVFIVSETFKEEDMAGFSRGQGMTQIQVQVIFPCNASLAY